MKMCNVIATWCDYDLAFLLCDQIIGTINDIGTIKNGKLIISTYPCSESDMYFIALNINTIKIFETNFKINDYPNIVLVNTYEIYGETRYRYLNKR